MERADICIVNLGLAKSRTHAKRIITEKRAFYGGKVIEKVSMIIENPNLITINSTFEDSYVGRGAIKLDSAIKNFNLDLNNLVCMDIGASTGGFTQIMLNENAKKVYAIDVGTNQLAKSLLADDRVVSLENKNFRYFRHLGIYGYTAKFLNELKNLKEGILEKMESLEQLRFIENGYKIKVLETVSNVIGVDTEEDLKEVIEFVKGKGIKIE